MLLMLCLLPLTLPLPLFRQSKEKQERAKEKLEAAIADCMPSFSTFPLGSAWLWSVSPHAHARAVLASMPT